MPQYLPLPDGNSLLMKDGESVNQAMARALEKYPESFGFSPQAAQQPESGFTPALKAGFKNLKGDVAALAGRSGLMDLASAEEYKKQQETEAKQIFKPTEEGWTESPWAKIKELAGGSLPYMVAPVAAGAAAAAAPVTGLAGTALAAGATGLTSAAQFTGSNLSRQMDEGKTLGQTDLGAAALAAVPQAALDVVSLKMIPGVRGLLAKGGVKVSEEAAQAAAQQGIKQVALDYAKATGKTMGVEGLTEAGQQVFERLQAGLSLSDPEARQEYFDSFVGGAVLGGTLAPAGRFIERGQEQAKARDLQDAAERKALEDAEAAKNSPEALKKLDTDYRTALQQKNALDAQLKQLNPGKLKKDATPEEKTAHTQAVEQYEAVKKARAEFIKDGFLPVRQEYEKRKDAIAQMDETRLAELEADTAEQPAAKEAIPADEPKRNLQRLMEEQDTLRVQLGQLESRVDEAAPEEFKALDTQRQELQRRIDARATLIEEMGGTPLQDAEFQQAAAAKMNAIDAQIKKAEAAFATARQNRDEKAGTLADEVIALKKQREDLAAQNQQQMQALQTKQLNRETRGQTIDLFAEAPATAKTADQQAEEKVVLAADRERALYGPESKRASALEAFGMADIGPRGQLEQTATEEEKQGTLPGLRFSQLKQATTKLSDAENKLATAVGSKDQAKIDAALKEVNKYEAEQSRLGTPFQKDAPIDIFDPSNLVRTAADNGDWETAMQYASARADSRAKESEAASKDREVLMNALDNRLGLGGEEYATTESGEKGGKLRNVERKQNDFPTIARTLSGLYSKAKPDHWSKYLENSERMLRSGVFPDAKVQAAYDASPEAFATDYIMQQVEALQKKVTTKQGNAKMSLYERMVALAGEEAVLLKRLETGIAKPTMGEKVARVNAKLGKAEAPGQRQMDAAELKQAEKRLEKVREQYAAILNPVTAVKNEILKLYGTLHTYAPLETVAKTQEAKKALSAAPAKEAASKLAAAAQKLKEARATLADAEKDKDAEAIAQAKQKVTQIQNAMRDVTTLSKEAKKAKQANEGVTQRQLSVEQSDTLLVTAAGLGRNSDAFLAALDSAGDELEAKIAKHGADSVEVARFREETRSDLQALAVREGRKTPEYKAARQELEEKLTPTKKQEPIYAKRTPETRTVSAGGRNERTGSPESRAATSAKNEAAGMRSTPSQVSAAMRGTNEKPTKGSVKKNPMRAEKGTISKITSALRGEKKQPLRGVETESMALTTDHVRSLEKGDLRGVLLSLSKDSKVDEFSRTVAARLAPLLDVTKIQIKDTVVDDEGKPVLGAATSKLIELNRDGGLSVETLLHEGTHAAAERVVQLAETDPSKLTREQKIAINELKALHAQIKRDAGITSKNAKGSLSEFVAEVMSNRNLQKQLAERKWRMSNMWNGIKSVIMRMLGVERFDTMFGAAAVSVDQLFVPASAKVGAGTETRTTRNLSVKDIAALHTGSNSMKQFSEQFGEKIKQKDRTPEDANRIGQEYLDDMYANPLDYVARADRLDYTVRTSDGKPFDIDDALHYVEADAADFAMLKAQEDYGLQEREALAITSNRKKDLKALIKNMMDTPEFTFVEQALVAKAASKYAVLSDKTGKLKLASIEPNNRHDIAVVSSEDAGRIIEELRAGKSLKQAFLDGMQKNADENAKKNERKNGWQKFEQSDTEKAAIELNAGCAGTPWCTGANVSTARSQISNGDFYVYYKNGRPEVAVRMDGTNKIGEVRGNSPSQSINKEQEEIARVFLQKNSFEKADQYLKEFETRKFVVALLKGETDYSLEELFSNPPSIGIDGKVTARAASKLLDFRTLDGYGGRPPATKPVGEHIRKRIQNAIDDAEKWGYYPTKNAKLLRDGTFEVDGAIVPMGKLKGAADLTLYSSVLRDLPNGSIPGLEYLSTLAPFGSVSLPDAKQIGELVIYENGTITLPKDVTLRLVRPVEPAEVVIKGPERIEAVRLQSDYGSSDTLDLTLPDTKYVNVTPPRDGFLGDIRFRVAQLLKEAKLDFDDDFDTFEAGLRAIGDRLGPDASEAIFDDHIYVDPETQGDLDDANGYISAFAEGLLKHEGYYDTKYGSPERQALVDRVAKKLNDAWELQDHRRFGEKGGSLDAPVKIADAPYGNEGFTEAPEQRRFAPKDVGVQDDGKKGFKFLRKKTPTSSVVAQEPGIVDKILGNIMGLAGRVQFIDQFAALSEELKAGLSKGVITSLEATNINYLIRFGQQRSQFAGQFMTQGRVKLEVTKKPGGVESVYRTVKSTNLLDVAEALNKAKLGDDVEQENMFTVYLAGERAKQVGWDKLNFSDPAKARAEYDAVLARLDNNKQAKDAFENAKRLYKEYNAGLMDFLVETGVLTASKAADLKSITYVPFYRINDNGEVQLMIDKEHPVRISNIKDQPQLKELVGGNTAIMPVFTSAAQNTFMITGLGLRNQAVKETAFTLKKLGMASTVREGKGPSNDSVVRFKKNGADYYAIIDKDTYGIPAELVVRGMEGIKTTLPAVIKMLGIPASILRSFVVRNPAYAVRQVIRDPLNAWLTTGTDATPVLSSMKELASMVAGRSEAERKLMESGAISSNIYAGDERDMSRFLKDVASGRSGWDKLLGKLDTFALQGDAATRAVIYRDSLEKGMTEQEALLRTLESMNFSRRGVSPSMQALSVMIPFFNAQVQGLDVIYRTFKGDMPYSEQLKIREKMVKRGLLLAAGTLAYAAMMEDDEAYKRAKPEERYSNWFVHVPGSKEPLRVPIPFEMGFIFKALPEAIWNVAAQDEKSSKAMSGLFKLAQQTNPFALPQAVKPLTEAVLGKSFYGGDIESVREQGELATERYRDSTTELSKMLGSVTGKAGVSAITLDHLIRGYTGPLGIALVQLANPLLAPDTKAEIAKPTTKLSQTPFIGGLFQPVEGRGTIDEAYDRMEEIRQTKGTFNKLVEEGKRAEANAFAQEYSDRIASMSVSGRVQKQLGELAKLERQIRSAPNLSQTEKDNRLEQIDKAKMAIARQFLAISDRTTRQ